MPADLELTAAAPAAGGLRRSFSWRPRFGHLLALLAAVPILALLALFIFLVLYAKPAMPIDGWHFLVRDTWNLGNLYADPVIVHGRQMLPGASYGILFLIVGTLASAVLAVVFALPLAVLSALLLAELLKGIPAFLASTLIELLAAVPSVVYGLWGYVFLIPFLDHHLYGFLERRVGPWLPFFAGPRGSGYGLLTSAIVLAIMVVPLITATLRDGLAATPRELREAGRALGATGFESAWRVVLRGQRPVLFGATILALGRALGETMAVLMVSGNALNYLPHNIYAPISTMAAFIVSQLDSALQDPTGMALRALAEIALVLLIITVAVNLAARLLLQFYGRRK